jgi:hypothetical protein
MIPILVTQLLGLIGMPLRVVKSAMHLPPLLRKWPFPLTVLLISHASDRPACLVQAR